MEITPALRILLELFVPGLDGPPSRRRLRAFAEKVEKTLDHFLSNHFSLKRDEYISPAAISPEITAHAFTHCRIQIPHVRLLHGLRANLMSIFGRLAFAPLASAVAQSIATEVPLPQPDVLEDEGTLTDAEAIARSRAIFEGTFLADYHVNQRIAKQVAVFADRADDAIQEAYCRLLEHFRDPTVVVPDCLSAYIKCAIANVARDHQRRAKPTSSDGGDIVIYRETDEEISEEYTAHVEKFAFVKNILHSAAPQDHALFVDMVLDDFAPQKVNQKRFYQNHQVGNPQAISKQSYRLFQRLQKLFAAHEGPQTDIPPQ